MPFGAQVNTQTVRTGNVRTSYDPASAVQTSSGTGVTPSYIYKGLYNTLGTVIIDQGGSDSVSGTTTQLPLFQTAVYKYVQYNSTTNPALTTAPGCVYYTDNTGTVVSGTATDGIIGKTTAASASDIAGIMMVNTTDLSTVTATLLNNSAGSGSGIWICIGGFCKAICCNSATTAGDYLYGIPTTTGTAFTSARVAAHSGTPLADRLLGIALTTAAQIGTSGVYTCDANILLCPFNY